MNIAGIDTTTLSVASARASQADRGSGAPPATKAVTPPAEAEGEASPAPAADVAAQAAADATAEALKPVELPEFARRELSFRLDRDLGRVVVQVIDPESGEVVRSIPPEELIRMAKQLRTVRGLLLDRKS